MPRTPVIRAMVTSSWSHSTTVTRCARDGGSSPDAARSSIAHHVPGPDAIGLVHWEHEDPPVADLAGSSRADDRSHHLVGDIVDHDGFYLDLGQERHGVLLASVDRCLPPLSTMAPHFGHGDAGHVQLGQGVLDLVDDVRPHDCLDQLHRCSSRILVEWLSKVPRNSVWWSDTMMDRCRRTGIPPRAP